MKTFLAVLLLCPSAALAQADHRTPTVLIRGNGNVVVSAAGIGVAASASASKHDQTIEMATQLLKHCREITLTLAESEAPDYVLVLNREGGGLFDLGDSQFMLLRGSDKTVLYANTKATVAKAMKEGCKVIMADWKVEKQIAKQKPQPQQSAKSSSSSSQDPADSKNWWKVEKKQDSTPPPPQP